MSPDYLRLVNGQISEFLYVYITDICQTSEPFGKKAQINHLLNLNISALRNNYVNIAKGTTDPGVDCFDQ